MELTAEQKELKKELAKYKRKVVELAGEVHDIVEDSIWTDYVRLAKLSEEFVNEKVYLLFFVYNFFPKW